MNRSAVKKYVGIALLWVALACLAYVPNAPDGIQGPLIAGAGFLCFATGILQFADGLKVEIVEMLRKQMGTTPPGMQGGNA